MRKLIVFLFVTLVMVNISVSAAAYDYANNELIHTVNYTKYTSKDTAAVKWDGKTEFKDNTYYYTTKSVTLSKNAVLPENSTLEVRCPLKITKKAQLQIDGKLIINYSGKVNPYNGKLIVSPDSYVDCYGALAISAKGSVDVYGSVRVFDTGSLTIKGMVSAKENGRVVCTGKLKRYQTAKILQNIIVPDNITDELSEKLEKLNANEKLRVVFMYYDSDIMQNTTVNGKNMLDIRLEIQENYIIPYLLSEQLFNGKKGSYKQIKKLITDETDVFIRYAKTHYGSSKTFKNYLSNSYFSDIIPNSTYADPKADVPSDNKHLVSEHINVLFDEQLEAAEKLNKAFYDQLCSEYKLEAVSIKNVIENGFGVFSATMTKADIEKLSDDKCFLFLSEDTNPDNNEKLYLANGWGGYYSLEEWGEYVEENGNGVEIVSANDIFACDDITSDEPLRTISKYTEVTWNSDFGSWYNTGEAGVIHIKLFDDASDGLYTFHSFADDLKSANRNVNVDYILDYSERLGVGIPCAVYHSVDGLAKARLTKLLQDGNVVLVTEGAYTLD